MKKILFISLLSILSFTTFGQGFDTIGVRRYLNIGGFKVLGIRNTYDPAILSWQHLPTETYMVWFVDDYFKRNMPSWTIFPGGLLKYDAISRMLYVDSLRLKGLVGTPMTNTIQLPGPKGDPGIPGIQGVTGQQGVSGIPGRDGKDGINGLPGKDGVNGKDGINGKDGAPGLPGKNGTDGTNGINGSNGKDGAPGVPGPKGDKGDPGSAGTGGGVCCTPFSNVQLMSMKLGIADEGKTFWNKDKQELQTWTGKNWKPTKGVL